MFLFRVGICPSFNKFTVAVVNVISPPIMDFACFNLCISNNNKKLSYCWETVRRESMPRIAEMDVEMTT